MTSRRVSAAGVDTHVYDAGTGDVPVVCVHGNPDSADQWAGLLERADELGRVVAPDLPGWGRSERPDREVFDGSLGALDRWFDGLLDALELQRFKLVVHDWGACALPAASRRPEAVERLVVIDAIPLSDTYKWHWISTYMWRPRGVGELTMRLFNRFTVKTLTRLQRPGFKALPDEWLDRVGRDLDSGMKDAILRLYRSADRDVLARAGERLGDLTCPSLVIWGDKDPYVGVDHARTYERALGGPTETWIVPGGGHWCMLDTDEVFERVARFVAQ